MYDAMNSDLIFMLRFIAEKSKGAPSWLSTGSPLDVTSPWQHNNVVQSCPSTHDSYCLSDGVCFYFPEMESYACKQVFAYIL